MCKGHDHDHDHDLGVDTETVYDNATDGFQGLENVICRLREVGKQARAEADVETEIVALTALSMALGLSVLAEEIGTLLTTVQDYDPRRKTNV